MKVPAIVVYVNGVGYAFGIGPRMGFHRGPFRWKLLRTLQVHRLHRADGLDQALSEIDFPAESTTSTCLVDFSERAQLQENLSLCHISEASNPDNRLVTLNEVFVVDFEFATTTLLKQRMTVIQEMYLPMMAARRRRAAAGTSLRSVTMA